MRLLLALGILGGAAWVAYAFVPSQCVPVTAETEVFCLRLWAPALFAMTAGFVGLRRWALGAAWRNAGNGFFAIALGTLVMAVANVGDYWLLSDIPYDSPDGVFRGILSVVLLFGMLLAMIAALGTGLVLILSARRTLTSRIMGSLMVSAACFSVFIGLLALGPLAAVTCLYGLAITRAPSPGMGPA